MSVAAATDPPLRVAAGAWHQLAGSLGIDPDVVALGRVPVLDCEAGVSEPADIGNRYEQALGWGDRHRNGVHYTRPQVARRLVAIAARPDDPGVVCDPAVGGGAFLLAAADLLLARGVPVAEIVGSRLFGLDVDPGAIMVAEAALAAWSLSRGGPLPSPSRLRVGDALDLGAEAATGWLGRRADLVVGNPPFQGQLTSDTVRSPAAHERLRERFGVRTGPYVDTAAWFLLAAVDMVDPAGGRVGLLQPWSVLAAGGVAGIRRHLDVVAPVVGFWAAGPDLFDASVNVCAPILQRGAANQPVTRYHGSSADRHDTVDGPRGGCWSGLAASLSGAPAVELTSDETLASLVGATAGFRDQFYGLVPHTTEGDGCETDERPPLVTVGMIDPLVLKWGSGRRFRFAGRSFGRPVVDRAALAATDPDLASWVSDRLVPKVLVATQTKVIEAVVDEQGRLVPSTPVISVEPHTPDDLWLVAAVLLAPAVSAWAHSRHGGAALTTDRLRLSAKQVLAIPLPVNGSSWREAASALSDGDLGRCSTLMNDAYGVGVEVATWWDGARPTG